MRLITSFWLYFISIESNSRKYLEKCAYFDMMRECGDSEAIMAREQQASNFLSNAVKMRIDMEQVEKTNPSKARDEGLISNDTPDKG